MSLSEFDNLSRKRINRIMEIREKQLEEQMKEKERQQREMDRRANATKGGGSQRIPIPRF